MTAPRPVHVLLRPLQRIRHGATAFLIAIIFWPATSSEARSITVNACQSSADHRTDAWTASSSTGQPVGFIDQCRDPQPFSVGTLEATGAFGFSSEVPAPDPPLRATEGRVIGLSVTALADTTLGRIDPAYTFAVASPQWAIRVKAAGVVVASCAGPTTATHCADGAPRTGTGFAIPAGTKTVDVAAYCVVAEGCDYDPGDAPTFSAVMREASVGLEDTTAPTADAPVADAFTDGRLTVNGTITVAGTDTTGLRTLEVLEGDRSLGTSAGTCVDWSLRPCAEASVGAKVDATATFTVGELELGPGRHTLRGRITDAAGNATLSAPLNVIVDETVLPATNLRGDGRSTAAIRELRWSIPDAMKAVAAAVELCTRTANPVCTTFDAPLQGPFTFASDAYPEVNARVRLTSEGGGKIFSQPAYYTWDLVAPLAPKLELYESVGASRTAFVTFDRSEIDLVSYVARLCSVPANVCSAVGSGPLSSPDVQPITVTAKLPGNANMRLDVMAVDEAGNVGPAGELILRPAAATGVIDPITKKPGSATLVPTLPRKLPKSSILVKGSTALGSATRATVTISGRSTKGKAVKTTKATVVKADGTFAVRLTLPRKLNRKKGLLVTITTAPATGWVASTVRKRVRP